MTLLGFTRPANRLDESIVLAESMGFQVLAAPSLDIIPADDSEFERLVSSIIDGSYVVFCSPTAVEQCVRRYGDAFPRMFRGTNVVPIGPTTARHLIDAGVCCLDMPDDFSSAGVVDTLHDSVGGRRVILIRSDSSSDTLSEGMVDAGADLVDIHSYHLEEAEFGSEQEDMMRAIVDGRMDVMAFTSPRSAESFIRRMDGIYEDSRQHLSSIRLAAIGEPTSRMLTSLGFPDHIVPERSTFEDMLSAIRDDVHHRFYIDHHILQEKSS